MKANQEPKDAREEYMAKCKTGDELPIFYVDKQIYEMAKIVRIMCANRTYPLYRFSDGRSYDHKGVHFEDKDGGASLVVGFLKDNDLSDEEFINRQTQENASEKLKHVDQLIKMGRLNIEEMDFIMSSCNAVEEQSQKRKSKEYSDARSSHWN